MRKFFHRVKIFFRVVILLLAAAVVLYYGQDKVLEILGFSPKVEPVVAVSALDLQPAGSIPTAPVSIPAYNGAAYTVLSGNVPGFGRDALSYRGSYARYSELDELGRAGPAMACIGAEDLPTAARGEIGDLRPSGWHTVRYDELIEDHYLFNRCHLIGYQLSGDNGDIHNLFTGTRYLNIEGMLPFENQVAQYLRQSENHVLYRVTPLYQGEDLVARGVQMEAWSLEDQGRGLCFHVFVHNVQPGVVIDYATGESRAA